MQTRSLLWYHHNVGAKFIRAVPGWTLTEEIVSVDLGDKTVFLRHVNYLNSYLTIRPEDIQIVEFLIP